MPEILQFGPYNIDREQRLLLKGDSIIPLAPKVFDLLLLLAESGGRVLEKKTLLDALWPDTFVEEGSLSRNIPRFVSSWTKLLTIRITSALLRAGVTGLWHRCT